MATVFPDRETFLELAAAKPRVPLERRFLSDQVSPISLYGILRQVSPRSFLLESGDGPEHATRFSFLGLGGELFGIDAEGRCFPDPDEHPFARIRARVESFAGGGHGPFPGGALGFLAYEAAGLFEDIPRAGPMPCPLMQFMEVDSFFVFDHRNRRLGAVTSVDTAGRDPGEAYAAGVRELDRLEGLVKNSGRPDLVVDPWFPEAPPPAEAHALYDQEAFQGGVETLKEHIRAGDIFQAVLSCRYEMEDEDPDLFELYRVMRATNPSPYMFHLRMDDLEVAGTSPEALVSVRGGLAEVRPIAGTRPRGASRDEDLALEEELLGDEKENAEHVMLVDLGRNDLGRVCAPGSVEVVDFKVIERYSQVMHIVSSVRGRLAEDRDALDALVATFPAGTVSGAPKIRAMELLASLEPEARGVYAGAVVYAGDGGDLDSCIAIRTVVRYGGRASVQAGAGIVHDSVPENEYQETRHKARAALRAAARR